MIKLDKKDRQILYELDLDSRQSFNQIGKKVRLSKEVVQYRIRQLEKKGVVKGYQTLVDVSKLGYISGRFFLKLREDTPEQEGKIIEYYKKHKKFWWVDQISGGFRDLGLACWIKDIYELYDIKEDLVDRFGKYINDLNISSYCKFYIYNRKYLGDSKERNRLVKVLFFPELVEFDEKDLKILRLIAGNARMNLVEISKKTGISVTNINYRIKKMIENGIIKGFKVLLDLNKIGYYWYKIEVQLSDLSVKKQMFAYFENHPNIVYAYETLSDNDIELELEVDSYEKFREVLEDIRKVFGRSIKKYYYFLWYKEHKFLFMP
ncbi:MAG: winged helix-turn-helix transcriptional regulator [Candidatus Nanoarchaeia archaeon]|nr:winged helix-turn-helix transcriptional regulator [Candidatus Nanoarchaeia archaeon]MDD5741666.1 winged helix-turn-helix transcriptional regulator [Candidatus Nanoarchaeia archaeon]